MIKGTHGVAASVCALECVQRPVETAAFGEQNAKPDRSVWVTPFVGTGVSDERTLDIALLLEEMSDAGRTLRIPVGVRLTVRGHRAGKISLCFEFVAAFDRRGWARRLTGCHPVG